MQPVNIKYKVFPELNLVLAVAAGQVDFEDTLRLIYCLAEEPNFKIGMNLLYDVRHVTGVKGNPENFQKAADYVSDPDIVREYAKTAFLLDDNSTSVKAYVEGYILMVSASRVEHRAYLQRDLSKLLIFLGIDELPRL